MHDGDAEMRHRLGRRSLSLFSVRGVSERHEKRKMQVSENAYIDATEEVPAS